VFVATNEALTRRQLKRANILLFVALGTFAGALGLSALRFDETLFNVVGFALIMGGLVAWQLSLAMTRRWGPRERQDDVLNRALRGLDNRYTLVAFADSNLPDYLLLGPLGVRVLVPRAIDGTVRYKDGRWSRDSSRRWLSLLTGDPVRNPTREAEEGIGRVERYLAAHPDPSWFEPVPVGASIIFTHPRVHLEVEGGPIPVTTAREARAHIQRLKGPLTPPQIAALRRLFAPAPEPPAATPATPPKRRAAR
jgi:hypothetical protein